MSGVYAPRNVSIRPLMSVEYREVWSVALGYTSCVFMSPYPIAPQAKYSNGWLEVLTLQGHFVGHEDHKE